MGESRGSHHRYFWWARLTVLLICLWWASGLNEDQSQGAARAIFFCYLLDQLKATGEM